MATVILVREPHLPNRTFPKESPRRADDRAAALAALHGDCDIEVDHPAEIIRVKTGDWYAKREG